MFNEWGFKDCIYALAEQICTEKTSDKSQMNPKNILNNTAISAQLPVTPFKVEIFLCVVFLILQCTPFP